MASTHKGARNVRVPIDYAVHARRVVCRAIPNRTRGPVRLDPGLVDEGQARLRSGPGTWGFSPVCGQLSGILF